MKTKVVEVWCALVMSAVLAGCADHDFDWDTAYRESNEYNYEAEFKSIYGEIPSNQNWDFSEGLHYGTRGTKETTYETIAGLDFGLTYPSISDTNIDNVSYTFGKNNDLYTSIYETLPESKVYPKTKAVVFTAPNNSFVVYPVSCSGAWTHELYIQVGNEDPVKLYTKDWTKYGHPYINGMISSITDNGSGKNPRYTASKQVSMPGIIINAEAGTPIQIYIDNISDGSNSKPSVGSGTGNTTYIEPNRPVTLDFSNLTEAQRNKILLYDKNGNLKSDIRYIGIEDQAGTWNADGTIKDGFGDKDFNDITLVTIGYPDVPHELVVEDGYMDRPFSVSKRYMVEDMGYSDPESPAVSRKYTDIDFNDIVIDFNRTIMYRQQTRVVNGKFEYVGTEQEISRTTTATVRALGGTWDFRLYVGTDEVFHKDGATQIGKTNGVINASERGPEKVDFNSAYPYFVGKPKPTLVSGIMYNTNRSTTMRGDGQFPGSEAEFRTSYICDLTADLSGWNPETNNISFVIVEDDNDIINWNMGDYFDSKGEAANGDNVTSTHKNVYTFSFPAMGACPKIVAFSTRKGWKREQVPVTRDWFTTDYYEEDEDDPVPPTPPATECETCHGTHAVDCPVCHGTGTVPEIVTPTWNKKIYKFKKDGGVGKNDYISGNSIGNTQGQMIIITKNNNNYLYDLGSKKFYTNNGGSISMTDDANTPFEIENNQYLKLGSKYIITDSPLGLGIAGVHLALSDSNKNNSKWSITTTDATGNTEVTAILDGMKYDSGNTVTCTHCHGYGQVACPDCCPDADLLWTADGGLEVSNNGAFIAKDDCNLPALEVGKMINFYLSLDVAAWQTPRLVVKACSWGLGIYDQSVGVQAGANGYTGKYEVSIMLTQDIIDALNTVDQYNNPHEYLFTIQGAYATLDAITVKESE